LIPTLLLVSFLVYAIISVAPGDPAQLMLGEGATAQAVAAKRIELGLNKPFIVQYLVWLKNVVFHFDFGQSYRSGINVAYQIMNYFPNTLKLTSLAVLISALIGIPLGIIAAVKQYSVFDNIVMSLAMIGMSIPAFVMALVMILIFSVRVNWLPSSGFSTASQMIMPVIALGMQPMAICARMTRSSLLEVIRQDYIRTIRAKGQKEMIVIVGHALKNAVLPILTTIGLQFGALIGGAFITETIFLIPGLGRLLVTAVSNRDYPLVLGGVVCVSIVVAITNLIVDIAYAFVDPRVKAQFRGIKGGVFPCQKLKKLVLWIMPEKK
jgi:peptide/nickel transport system permease protein